MAAPGRKPSARRQRSKSVGGSAPTDAVFTIDDLVVYLKLPKSTVYKLAQEGRIPGKKIGRHWRFHKEAIDNWLTEGHALAQKVWDRK